MMKQPHIRSGSPRTTSRLSTKIGTWKRWSTAAKRRELFAKSSSFVFVFSRAELLEEKALPLSWAIAQRSCGLEMNSPELVQSQVRAPSSEPELGEHLIPSQPPNQYIADDAPEGGTPVAFACYRIVKENVSLESSGIRPICKQLSLLYLYELHCTRSWRSKGIGTLLLQMAENIAANAGAAGVALTCLKNNRESLVWYKHRGYERAPHCPDAGGKSAYQILWKPFKR
ncbi:hypothetical protein F1559_003708 [Cyanidiococcus yangmingshanensis]|uniref:N-alpha-acetyltransferase 40 n=1 Tax=Cyanidiococcus yangmingshanensis TaxID=2690220 RepID=A0A7J7IP65_9RHOD|nr:hypothetical protein F1559_003708 [Cyanidiococcus yangmingshanensis]